MIYLNLTPNFEPFGLGSIKDVSRPFPSGLEANIKLEVAPGRLNSQVTITIRFSNHEDLMRIALAANALRLLGFREIHLFIPYLPYARQDRAVAGGESFALKVFANYINALSFASVTAFDVHSNVAGALINNFVNISAAKAAARSILSMHIARKSAIVIPDAGAVKRAEDVIKGCSLPVIQALKRRNKETGAIEGVELFGDFEGIKQFFIVDDICDGGATFIALAKSIRDKIRATAPLDTVIENLRGVEINLWVSHGIFSKGINHLLLNGIDSISTTDSIGSKSTTPVPYNFTYFALKEILNG